MSDLIHLEEFESNLEVRDIEKREVFGRIVPYGEQILVRGRPESFTTGALSDVDRGKVKLFDHHDRAVGKMVGLEEREDGAYGTFYVSKTNRGDELLELASDGVLSFSPGFQPGVQTREGVHTRVKAMPEVSLVSIPAYSRAEVLAVREKEANVPTDTPAEGAPAEAPVVDFTPLESRMDDITNRLEKLQSVVDAPPVKTRSGGPRPLDWFAAQIEGLVGESREKRDRFDTEWSEFQTRALDDVTGTYPGATPIVDASGLVSQEYIASQLVSVVDARRPMFSNLGRFPMPRSGYAVIPVVTQHTEVGARTTQKAEAATRPLIVQKRSFEADWFSGAVDIALELIRSAELPVLDMVWNDLLGQYASVTEAAVVEGVDAGGLGFTYTGTALPTNTYAAFIGAVLGAADTVEDNSGAVASVLFVTRTQFNALLGLINPTVFTATGDGNGATVDLTAQSFVIPGSGIKVVKTKNLAQAVLTNEQSLKAADGGPERVEATNVALMGQDLGLLGRIMLVPRIPAGTVVLGNDPTSS